MFGLFGGKSFEPAKDIPDLSSKVIIVTGGNTGLGKESVLQLAKHNPSQIYLAARTESKATSAIEEIKSQVPNAKVEFLSLDLTDFDSVKSAAETFKQKEQRLDILLNNAGVMAMPYSKTKQGYEIQFGTNHMGHALFTKLLLPTLLKTAEEPNADVRIVTLSSEGHNLAPRSCGVIYDQAAAETFGPWGRYGSAKLANILYSRGLTAHYPSLTCVAVHPGVIKTELYNSTERDNALIRYGLAAVGNIFMASVPQGTKNQLWAATAAKEEVRKAYFFTTPVGSASQGSGFAKDQKGVDKLWEWTEEELKKHGY
ncbi:NAD(P)-binding protein [Aureobasidium pullulans]|uniref:NAD(P)-binding protein n=1 Tax=Aureobasidium pullulans TaxID=5580 RepID=A0A4S9D653_AURPU|nr:NAD(P)-binding protein [Aureobasidium pullulans]THX14917.1 NAD(P)-binding protein [Aureobasidium pullulans]